MALNKACLGAVFISLPRAPLGNWNGFLTNDSLRQGATMRSTSAAGCTVVNPAPTPQPGRPLSTFRIGYMK